MDTGVHSSAVAHALLRAVSRLIATPLPTRTGVDKSVDAARRSACATNNSNRGAAQCTTLLSGRFPPRDFVFSRPQQISRKHLPSTAHFDNQRRTRFRHRRPSHHHQHCRSRFHRTPPPEPGSRRNPPQPGIRGFSQIDGDHPEPSRMNHQVRRTHGMLDISGASNPDQFRNLNPAPRGRAWIESVSSIDHRRKLAPARGSSQNRMQQTSPST